MTDKKPTVQYVEALEARFRSLLSSRESKFRTAQTLMAQVEELGPQIEDAYWAWQRAQTAVLADSDADREAERKRKARRRRLATRAGQAGQFVVFGDKASRARNYVHIGVTSKPNVDGIVQIKPLCSIVPPRSVSQPRAAELVKTTRGDLGAAVGVLRQAWGNTPTWCDACMSKARTQLRPAKTITTEEGDS